MTTGKTDEDDLIGFGRIGQCWVRGRRWMIMLVHKYADKQYVCFRVWCGDVRYEDRQCRAIESLAVSSRVSYAS